MLQTSPAPPRLNKGYATSVQSSATVAQWEQDADPLDNNILNPTLCIVKAALRSIAYHKDDISARPKHLLLCICVGDSS